MITHITEDDLLGCTFSSRVHARWAAFLCRLGACAPPGELRYSDRVGAPTERSRHPTFDARSWARFKLYLARDAEELPGVVAFAQRHHGSALVALGAFEGGALLALERVGAATRWRNRVQFAHSGPGLRATWLAAPGFSVRLAPVPALVRADEPDRLLVGERSWRVRAARRAAGALRFEERGPSVLVVGDDR